jgi:hypothetical protein
VATRGLIGSRHIDLMQRHALLVNTARGGIIDEAAAPFAFVVVAVPAGVPCHSAMKQPVSFVVSRSSPARNSNRSQSAIV